MVPEDEDYIPGVKNLSGLQHVFTMFGSTVLVPILTGLNVSVALFGAGQPGHIFHYLTSKDRFCKPQPCLIL